MRVLKLLILATAWPTTYGNGTNLHNIPKFSSAVNAVKYDFIMYNSIQHSDIEPSYRISLPHTSRNVKGT